jgi:hypothetical protein
LTKRIASKQLKSLRILLKTTELCLKTKTLG